MSLVLITSKGVVRAAAMAPIIAKELSVAYNEMIGTEIEQSVWIVWVVFINMNKYMNI
jgi:hypothetical protein